MGRTRGVPLEIHREADARTLAHPGGDPQAVAAPLDVGKPHAGSEAQGPGLRVGGGEALSHCQVDVGDAGAEIEDIDMDGLFGQVGLQPAALSVDDYVHLGFVCGDHGPPDGFRVDADAFEVLLERP
jgi:hypothetical protein